jgi:hypothetical protein
MTLKHKVTINITGPGNIRAPVLRSGRFSMRNRLMKLLFGDEVGLLMVAPGDSVESVEIREVGKGGPGDGQDDHAQR